MISTIIITKPTWHQKVHSKQEEAFENIYTILLLLCKIHSHNNTNRMTKKQDIDECIQSKSNILALYYHSKLILPNPLLLTEKISIIYTSSQKSAKDFFCNPSSSSSSKHYFPKEELGIWISDAGLSKKKKENYCKRFLKIKSNSL